MSSKKMEEKAVSLLRAFEGAGKAVSRVTVDGRKIEIVLSNGESCDEFDGIDMRHVQT